MNELVGEVLTIADQDEEKIDEEHPDAEFFSKIREEVGEARNTEKEKQEEAANANKANEDDEDIELDAKDMKVRVPDKFLYKILQKRL